MVSDCDCEKGKREKRHMHYNGIQTRHRGRKNVSRYWGIGYLYYRYQLLVSLESDPTRLLGKNLPNLKPSNIGCNTDSSGIQILVNG